MMRHHTSVLKGKRVGLRVGLRVVRLGRGRGWVRLGLRVDGWVRVS
jgi:hypothetical protein